MYFLIQSFKVISNFFTYILNVKQQQKNAVKNSFYIFIICHFKKLLYLLEINIVQ